VSFVSWLLLLVRVLTAGRHEIYKWHAEQGREHLRRPRSVSFSGPQLSVDPAFQHIHEPGGFRRNYLMLAAREQGQEDPRMLHNFIEFLYLYGHFVSQLLSFVWR
jgi:proton-coupled amino acid transporter